MSTKSGTKNRPFYKKNYQIENKLKQKSNKGSSYDHLEKKAD